MTRSEYQPRLYWFAISTVLVLMTTLSAGALVTSKNAGMAFRDWPTSDGQSMLTYPWLADFARNWDKFLEHGHRLAGLLIGCWVLALVTAVIRWEPRRWVKLLAGGLLLGVIMQGVLGGFRVWLDERGLALVHGFFAACVTALLLTLVTVLSRSWIDAPRRWTTARLGLAQPLAVMLVALVAVQYLLGGAIRHHGSGLHEHLGLGLLVAVLTAFNASVSVRTRNDWIAATGLGLLLIVSLQVGLGAATWVAKWGLPASGHVATADSIEQVALRTLHMLLGVFVFATTVVHALRVFRVSAVTAVDAAAEERQTLSIAATGGAR